MRVSEPAGLRAMAHPLRLDLLELLATTGPATAAECGRRLGVGQASCSYHLRLLERYGFVEQAEPRGDRRERPWRLLDVRQSWSGDGPETEELERVFVRREADRILASQHAGHGEAPPWRDAAFITGVTVPLTATELGELRTRLESAVEPYLSRLGAGTETPAGHRWVRVLLAASPDPPDPPPTSATEPEEPA